MDGAGVADWLTLGGVARDAAWQEAAGRHRAAPRPTRVNRFELIEKPAAASDDVDSRHCCEHVSHSYAQQPANSDSQVAGEVTIHPYSQPPVSAVDNSHNAVNYCTAADNGHTSSTWRPVLETLPSE